MYIIAEETIYNSIAYYTGYQKGHPGFISGGGATKYAIKYKTFSGAKRALKKLEVLPGAQTAKLFILPEDVYNAYEEWFDRRAARLRKEAGIE